MGTLVLIIIGHYFLYWYWLFLKDVIYVIKSVPIMSFLVIIASLIAFMILRITEKMLNQKPVAKCRYNIGSVSVISISIVTIGLLEYR